MPLCNRGRIGHPPDMQGHEPTLIVKTAPSSRNPWVRRLPVLAILAAALAGAVLLREQLSFETLAANREALLAFRDAHYLPTVLAFMAAYAAIVALSLPGGTVASLTGGFLFGLFPGVLYNVTGATLGAILIFLAVRAGFGNRMAARVAGGGGGAARLMAGIRENEWSVLFLMRLIPAVPFVLANLIPAFTGIRLRVYATTTFFGIIPAALVFTSIGAGLGEVFARGDKPDLSIVFTPPILLPMLGLAALAALPMVLKALRKGR